MVKKVLFIIAFENFRDEEFFEPKAILETSGFKTAVASSKKGTAESVLGKEQMVEKTIFDVNVADYIAVIFVGGSGAVCFFEDPIALAIAEETVFQRKVLGAICIAPSILANAGVLTGKKATCFSSEKEKLIAKGAEFIDEPVVIDGKIITANGPSAAKDFGWKIVEMLASH